MPARISHRMVRATFLAIAALLHVLVWLLWPRTAPVSRYPPADVAGQLIFIESKPVAPAPADPAVAKAPAGRAAPAEVAPAAPTTMAPAGTGTLPDATGITDWYTEAQVAARGIAPEVARRACPRGTHLAKSGETCEPDRDGFEWKDESDRRAGFSGGLPFIRLGDCRLGLGFFGCPLGARPEVNSHLLDGMNDPERDRSSVPAATEPTQ